MPLIKDINERRYAFQARRSAQLGQIDDGRQFQVKTSDTGGLDKLVETYVNRSLMLRVNRKLANEFRAGMSGVARRDATVEAIFPGHR